MATKSETSAKAKASVKNVIKIAIGELKKKRKKKTRKTRKAPPPPQVQSMGNRQVLASSAPPIGNLLQLGREFRDVQISQRQILQDTDARIATARRQNQIEVDRIRRALRDESLQRQGFEIGVTGDLRDVATVALTTARALEAESGRGIVTGGLSAGLKTVGLGRLTGQTFVAPPEAVKVEQSLAKSAKQPAVVPTRGGSVGGAGVAMKGQGGGGGGSFSGLTSQQIQRQIRQKYEQDIQNYLSGGADGNPDLSGLKGFSQGLGRPVNASKDAQRLATSMLKQDSPQYQEYLGRMMAQTSTPMKGGGGMSQSTLFEGEEEEEEEG